MNHLISTEVSDVNSVSAGLQWISGHSRSWYAGGSPRATCTTVLCLMFLMRHLISTVCSRHRNFSTLFCAKWKM